ncbi:MAG: gamma carbonic anhydrase family protein [Planctomycetota bacterium]|nr:MAG: gamma carbonic anhydrase family protein [Planctomycetota bacterium]
MRLSFENFSPKVDPSAFVEETARIIGDVVLGAESSVWFHSVVRGDVHYIRIGSQTNLQDGCVVHVSEGTHPTVIGNRVTVGHRAVIHGCTIEDYCLIGMGSVILDGAVIPKNSLVAAGSLVPPGFRGEENSLILGSPARVVRPLREKEKAMIEEGWRHYVELAKKYASSS